ncbi:MAG TPA: STAS domain-containing protein [Pseudonocardia sp.]
MTSPLTIRVSTGEGRPVVTLAGEIDPWTGEEFQAGLEAAISENEQVTVDLRDVVFMDSTGLAVLFRHHESVLSVIARPGSVTARALSRSGLGLVIAVDLAD